MMNLDGFNYLLDTLIDGSRILDHLYKMELKKTQNYFLFLHFLDTHLPYFPPKEFIEKYLNNFFRSFSEKEIQELFKLAYKNPAEFLRSQDWVDVLWKMYLASANYFDYLFGELLDFLHRKGLLEKSMLILMADHGEAFGEHGYLSHPMTKHHSEQIRIPLIVNATDTESYRSEALVDELDVVPTILGFVGTNEYKRYLPGRDLLQGKGKPFVLTLGDRGTFSLTTEKFRFINDDESVKLYDFSDVEESKEKRVSEEKKEQILKQVQEIRKFFLTKKLRFLSKLRK